MGNSGKMEESRKQRQTNLRKSHRSGVVFVCGHDELRNDAYFSLNWKSPLRIKKIHWAHLLALSCYYMWWFEIMNNIVNTFFFEREKCEHILVKYQVKVIRITTYLNLIHLLLIPHMILYSSRSNTNPS